MFINTSVGKIKVYERIMFGSGSMSHGVHLAKKKIV